MQAEATSKLMRNRFRPGKKKRRNSHPRRVFTNSLSGSKKMFSASLPDFNDALSTMLKSTSSIAPRWWLNHPSCSQNAHCFPKDRGENKKNIWNRHRGTKMSNLRMLFQPLPNLLAPLLSEGTMDCLDHTWRMRWQLEKRQWKRTARPYGWSNWMGHTILKIFKKIMPHIGPLSASKNSKGAFSKMTLPGSEASSLQKMGRKFIHLSPSQQNLKKRTQVCTFSNSAESRRERIIWIQTFRCDLGV